MHKNIVILFNFVFVIKTCSMSLRHLSIPNFMHSFNTLKILTIYGIEEKSRIYQLHSANDFKCSSYYSMNEKRVKLHACFYYLF